VGLASVRVTPAPGAAEAPPAPGLSEAVRTSATGTATAAATAAARISKPRRRRAGPRSGSPPVPPGSGSGAVPRGGATGSHGPSPAFTLSTVTVSIRPSGTLRAKRSPDGSGAGPGGFTVPGQAAAGAGGHVGAGD